MKHYLLSLLLVTASLSTVMMDDAIHFCDSTFNVYYIKYDGDTLKLFHKHHEKLSSQFKSAGFALLDKSLVIQLEPSAADLHYDLDDFSVLIRLRPHEKTCTLYVFDCYNVLTHVKLHEIVRSCIEPKVCVVNFIVKPQDQDIQFRKD